MEGNSRDLMLDIILQFGPEMLERKLGVPVETFALIRSLLTNLHVLHDKSAFEE
jgi:hypothetical protein